MAPDCGHQDVASPLPLLPPQNQSSRAEPRQAKWTASCASRPNESQVRIKSIMISQAQYQSFAKPSNQQQTLYKRNQLTALSPASAQLRGRPSRAPSGRCEPGPFPLRHCGADEMGHRVAIRRGPMQRHETPLEHSKAAAVGPRQGQSHSERHIATQRARCGWPPALLLGLVVVLSLCLAASITGVLAVDCFKCSSRNGSNPACEDPFHNLNTTRVNSPIMPDPPPNVAYHTPCYAGKKGRDGLFPASACIKLTGTFEATGETLVVRHCALDSGTLTQDTELARMSHCGKFQFEGDLLRGCVLACPKDACNSAPISSFGLNFKLKPSGPAVASILLQPIGLLLCSWALLLAQSAARPALATIWTTARC